jgi:hypothetical protein
LTNGVEFGVSRGNIKPLLLPPRGLVRQVGAQNDCRHPCLQSLIDKITQQSANVYCGDYVFFSEKSPYLKEEGE